MQWNVLETLHITVKTLDKSLNLKLPPGVDPYEFDERAGIKEFCGKMPRQVAEFEAMVELTAKFRQPAMFDNTFTQLVNNS